MKKQPLPEALEQISTLAATLGFKGDVQNEVFKPSAKQKTLSPNVKARVQVMMGSDNCEQTITQLGADPSYQKNGLSNLLLASLLGHDNVVKILKNHGARMVTPSRPKNKN